VSRFTVPLPDLVSPAVAVWPTLLSDRTAWLVVLMSGGVMSPVASSRTARMGRYLPWALVRMT
jgi:hypothetical protein